MNQLSPWPPHAPAADFDPRRLAAAEPRLARYYARQGLGRDFIARVPGVYLPMAAWLARRRADADNTDGAANPGILNPGMPLLVGINGSQGSGKSTLAGLLRILLEEVFRLRTATVSIDDFYLTKEERRRLAQTLHPLFITRGPPGTHDVPLAADTLAALARTDSATVALPSFDKTTDDRAPVTAWPAAQTPLDIILFEGWCVGARPQAKEQLARPINELEEKEDPDAIWRAAANDFLATDYRPLFAPIDLLVMLKAPSMRQVHEWRALQERKLRERRPPNAPALMDRNALRRFIMHYERLTRHQLKEMPPRADAVLSLDAHHQIAAARLRPSRETKRWATIQNQA